MIQSVRRREPEEAGRGAADEEEEEAMRKKRENDGRNLKMENLKPRVAEGNDGQIPYPITSLSALRSRNQISARA
jgi:hypothetical protein